MFTAIIFKYSNDSSVRSFFLIFFSQQRYVVTGTTVPLITGTGKHLLKNTISNGFSRDLRESCSVVLLCGHRFLENRSSLGSRVDLTWEKRALIFYSFSVFMNRVEMSFELFFKRERELKSIFIYFRAFEDGCNHTARFEGGH